MILAIGSDHRGYALKTYLQKALPQHQWLDVGAHHEQRSDYPDFATQVCQALLQGDVERGILICGSGIGMAIAANRMPGIYAALCWNEVVARLASEHDGANILVLPSDFVTHEQALAIVQAWLGATFRGGRYQERLDRIDE